MEQGGGSTQPGGVGSFRASFQPGMESHAWGGSPEETGCITRVPATRSPASRPLLLPATSKPHGPSGDRLQLDLELAGLRMDQQPSRLAQMYLLPQMAGHNMEHWLQPPRASTMGVPDPGVDGEGRAPLQVCQPLQTAAHQQYGLPPLRKGFGQPRQPEADENTNPAQRCDFSTGNPFEESDDDEDARLEVKYGIIDN
ncbi:hypothetical protein WJX84_005234 [Apatococcus fuscideae]|uniref:Uncharacterized protein n=1 Tax=Apatococcus fuscideae TaxID=2026836 RepID=A0AAW1RZZ9_9CHLO